MPNNVPQLAFAASKDTSAKVSFVGIDVFIRKS